MCTEPKSYMLDNFTNAHSVTHEEDIPLTREASCFQRVWWTTSSFYLYTRYHWMKMLPQYSIVFNRKDSHICWRAWLRKIWYLCCRSCRRRNLCYNACGKYLFLLGVLWRYLLYYRYLLELNLHSAATFSCVRSDIYQIHSILSIERHLQQFIFVHWSMPSLCNTKEKVEVV